MARDGTISIAIDVDGKDVGTASDSLKGLEGDARKVKGGTDTASRGIKDIVVSLGLVKIGAAAFSILANSMDAAISRFDTFQTFPKVMDALGESAEASQAGIDKLSDGIDGLPTKLDDIVSVTQRMYTSFNNLDDATDTALALNNALLASGASAADASRGTDQYIQGLQKGKFEMEEWKTLQETMTIGLFQIAQSFGMTERELKAALDSGEVSMSQFNDRMIELGTGTGTLAELAKENSKGIATSLSNLRNTASRGLADILTAFNDLSVEVTGSTIAEHIDRMKVIINSAFKSIGGVIRGLSPILTGLITILSITHSVAKFLSPVILGLAAAYTALMIINKINDIIDNNTELLSRAALSGKELIITTNAQIAAQAAKTSATIADTTAQMANNGALTIGQMAIGILTGNLGLATAATALKTKAVTVLSGALKVLSGPIGWVVAGIGLLTAGGVALVKWLNRSSEEGKKLAKQTEELGAVTNDLTSDVEANQKGYEKQIRQTEASAAANADLALKIEELTSMEELSGKEKKLLTEYVGQLNGQIDGLNLAYDEEANALNMSSEQIQKRIELMAEQEAATAAQERLLEISKEQHEVDMQLEQTNALRAEYNQKLEEGTITNKEYKDSVAELDEQEQTLKETQIELGDQYSVTEEQMVESMGNVTQMAEESVGKQLILYGTLSEGQQAAVDEMRSTWLSYQEAATDMFDTLSDKSELSVAEMTANMEENQRVIGNWSENIATLAERGVDEGLLETLREAGPQSAGHVQAMVDASDTELDKLSTVFAEGGDVATDALSTSLGEGAEGALDEVGHLVVGMEETLKEKIEAADFPSIGGDVATGTADGVSDNADKAVDAVKTMADDMTSGAREVLRTQSPSKEFYEIGEDTTDGLALGVTNNINTVLDAMRRVASQMPKPFDYTPRDFRSIGQQAMNGLVWGLNNGRGRVMATARSIANSIRSTMQSALRIQSPSGVMKDDVGRWIPEGLAEGIEGNTKSVFDALDKMTNGMVKRSTPEMALGIAGGGAMAGTYNRTINNNPQTSSVDNRNFTFNANANGTENNDREFYERLFKEFKWYIQQEGGAFD